MNFKNKVVQNLNLTFLSNKQTNFLKIWAASDKK